MYLKTSVSMPEDDKRILVAVAERLGITPSAALRVAVRSMAINLRIDPGATGAANLDGDVKPSAMVIPEAVYQPRAEEPQPQRAQRRGWGFAVTGQYRSWTRRKPPGYWTGGPGYRVAADPSLTPEQAAERLVAEGDGYGEPVHLLATRVAWVRKNKLRMAVPNYSEYLRRYNQAP